MTLSALLRLQHLAVIVTLAFPLVLFLVKRPDLWLFFPAVYY